MLFCPGKLKIVSYFVLFFCQLSLGHYTGNYWDWSDWNSSLFRLSQSFFSHFIPTLSMHSIESRQSLVVETHPAFAGFLVGGNFLWFMPWNIKQQLRPRAGYIMNIEHDYLYKYPCGLQINRFLIILAYKLVFRSLWNQCGTAWLRDLNIYFIISLSLSLSLSYFLLSVSIKHEQMMSG